MSSSDQEGRTACSNFSYCRAAGETRLRVLGRSSKTESFRQSFFRLRRDDQPPRGKTFAGTGIEFKIDLSGDLAYTCSRKTHDF